MNEKDIVEAVLDGDTGAYAELVTQHQVRVYRVCLGFLSNPPDAEDAAQDIFVKAFDRLSSFQRNSLFSTWITRIAHNHCLDVLRKQKRQRADSLEEALEKGHEPAGPEYPDQLEDKSLVTEVLAGLKIEAREILVLREVGGLTYDEIASQLHCSLDAVKARLKRARIQLKESARHLLDPRNV